ncbi:MAG: dienelactone hydrolase family protein [Bacteroidetes bacterium]|nr:dienelactone hydrolase family protein [Bacteroidota bacterium]
MYTYYKHEIEVRMGNVRIGCELTIPVGAKGIIIFCQAEGNSRYSPNCRMAARYLNKNGFGTVLPELLTPEESNGDKALDMDLLTARLMSVTEWLMDRDRFHRYRLGYYACGSGAAFALEAAAYLPEAVDAVVCRSGRPVLKEDIIQRIEAPVLMIAAAMDRQALQLNREAMGKMRCERQLIVLEGTTSSFGDGRMEQVMGMTRSWFLSHMKMAEKPTFTGSETAKMQWP